MYWSIVRTWIMAITKMLQMMAALGSMAKVKSVCHAAVRGVLTINGVGQLLD